MGFNSSFSFFGIGIPELVLIVVLALVVLGPERLPGMAKDLIRAFFRVRNLSRDLTGQLEKELHLDEIREVRELKGLKTGSLVEAWANDELDINLDGDGKPDAAAKEDKAKPADRARPAQPALKPRPERTASQSPRAAPGSDTVRKKVDTQSFIESGMTIGPPAAKPATGRGSAAQSAAKTDQAPNSTPAQGQSDPQAAGGQATDPSAAT